MYPSKLDITLEFELDVTRVVWDLHQVVGVGKRSINVGIVRRTPFVAGISVVVPAEFARLARSMIIPDSGTNILPVVEWFSIIFPVRKRLEAQMITRIKSKRVYP